MAVEEAEFHAMHRRVKALEARVSTLESHHAMLEARVGELEAAAEAPTPDARDLVQVSRNADGAAIS
jgi:hypothetical protein